MRSFTDYTEKAIVRFGLTGYNNLAREIGITKASMSMFRSGKALPSEETFLKIVELAGLPKEEALIDLNLWRSKDKPEVQKIWQRLSKMIGCVLAILFAPFNCLAASGAQEVSNIGVIFALLFIYFMLQIIYYATNVCLSRGVFPLIISAFSKVYTFCQKLIAAKKTVAAICVMRNGGQCWSAVT